MNSPIDQVLSRLDSYKLRENGRDRWRACCPAHGGKNASALSIGVGQEGQVLLKCWHGCSADEVAGALGLELTELFPPKQQTVPAGAQMKRRRLLSAAQALDLLSNEITVTLLCASDMAGGKALDEGTRQRLLQGAARVSMLQDEVRA